MTSRTARSTSLFAAIAAALVFTGCGGQGSDTADGGADHSGHGASAAAGDGQGSSVAAEADHDGAGHNADDISFATDMIPHHRQAVEMSALVDGRTANPDVVALSQEISAAQQPEIDTMTGWLAEWGAPAVDEHAGHAGHGGHDGMPGMLDEATMARLASLNDAEFDRLWLESMIAHHEGAVTMAEQQIAHGANAEATALARTMVDTQQAEIDRMRQLLGQ